jgi:perosamine synthetase
MIFSQYKGVVMLKPTVLHELEVAYGTIYGFEEARALMDVLKNLAPSCGKKVKEFEDSFSSFCGAKYGAAVTNATTGLKLAGIAAGIKNGDEVITTPISWISTATAFSELGAKIVFCDVDKRTLNLNPDLIESLITPRTKAIVPVHLYGQCCRMDKIMEIAKKHNLAVIEDCAHNPGGSYMGKKAGSWGDFGVFSFHQQKNMSTLGEGGMVITSEKKYFESLISYRSLCCRIYGESDKYLSIDEKEFPMEKEYWKLLFDDIGFNYRMTDAQAAVGIEQLKKLDKFNEKRIELAGKLTCELEGTEGITLPYVDRNGKHVFHIYMILLNDKCKLDKKDFMWELYTGRGIKAWSHYMPIHLSKPYLVQGHKAGECPVAEDAFKKYVTLPMHPRLTDDAIKYMAQSIKSILGQ